MKTTFNEYNNEMELNPDINPFDLIFGGSKLWSQIVREAEKDVAADKKDKNSENFKGLDNIIKLINDNITEPDGMKINEEEANKLRENFRQPYKILKKELDDVRVLRTGKTAPEKILAVGKSIGRFVSELTLTAVSLVGTAINTAGKLVHFTPAAYILNRAPLISKTEKTFSPTKSGGYDIKTKRSNFLEIISEAIHEGAAAASLKYGMSPIFTKVVTKYGRGKAEAEAEDVGKEFSKSNIRQQVELTMKRVNFDLRQANVIDKISQSLPNIRKGNPRQR